MITYLCSTEKQTSSKANKQTWVRYLSSRTEYVDVLTMGPDVWVHRGSELVWDPLLLAVVFPCKYYIFWSNCWVLSHKWNQVCTESFTSQQQKNQTLLLLTQPRHTLRLNENMQESWACFLRTRNLGTYQVFMTPGNAWSRESLHHLPF